MPSFGIALSGQSNSLQYLLVFDIEQVEEKEMPMPSYTYLGLHGDANLTDQQREVLIKWAKSQMAMLKATYPADSLKMKPRPKS